MRYGRRAFTLIELLVVIGIIGLLMAILIPAIGKARRQAKIAVCAANLRQLATAMNSYATDQDGAFPSFPINPVTGYNMWDVAHGYYNALARRGVPQEAFFCPASSDPESDKAGFARYNWFYIIGYNVWIPHLDGSQITPPAPTFSGTGMKIVMPRPATPFAAPLKRTDPLVNTNPLITDIAGSTGAAPPASADASDPGNPWGVTTNHRDGNRIYGVNCAFADGHVELHGPTDMHPYFEGNHWNWR